MDVEIYYSSKSPFKILYPIFEREMLNKQDCLQISGFNKLGAKKCRAWHPACCWILCYIFLSGRGSYGNEIYIYHLHTALVFIYGMKLYFID